MSGAVTVVGWIADPHLAGHIVKVQKTGEGKTFRT